MNNEIVIPQGTSKEEKYTLLLRQIKALISGEDNLIANLANISAALKQGMGFFWVGFYLVENKNELVLAPFQGPVACTRLKKGKGVCGVAWEKEETIIVDDVEKFPGHVACNSASKSEIVVPFGNENKIVGILDIDSDRMNDFDEIDAQHLEILVKWIPLTS